MKIQNLFRFGLSLSAGILLSAFVMGGCPSGLRESPGPTGIRYVNMATNAQMTTSTCVFETITLGPIAQFGSTGFQFVNTYNGAAVVTDKDGNNVFSKSNFVFNSDSIVSLISLGDDTNVELVAVGKGVDRVFPGAGEINITFVNGVEQSFGIDIYVLPTGGAVAGTPVVSGITFTEQSSQTMTFDGLSKDLVACFHGTTTEMFRTTVDPTGGTEYLATLVSPSGVTGSFRFQTFLAPSP